MALLITGGAGYIGSHFAHLAIAAGRQVIIVDNLSYGNSWAIPTEAKFYKTDILDTAELVKIINKEKISVVVHFAGVIEVGESVTNPIKYYWNNTAGAISLLRACQESGVTRFIFSSTAAVYGTPETVPIVETHERMPINPYGRSKEIFENVLLDHSQADATFSYVALRYFNVAGAQMNPKTGQPTLKLGQASQKSTHLIKIAAEAASGKRDRVKIYGTDYSTKDGTCIRDYIHVDDLANAHILAIKYLEQGGKSDVFNCGYGRGFTVKEVLSTMKKVSGVNFLVENENRRMGDPPSLVANNEKIKKILSWQPQYFDLEVICKSAFGWEQTLNAKNK